MDIEITIIYTLPPRKWPLHGHKHKWKKVAGNFLVQSKLKVKIGLLLTALFVFVVVKIVSTVFTLLNRTKKDNFIRQKVGILEYGTTKFENDANPHSFALNLDYCVDFVSVCKYVSIILRESEVSCITHWLTLYYIYISPCIQYILFFKLFKEQGILFYYLHARVSFLDFWLCIKT